MSGLLTCKMHLTNLNVNELYMFFAAAYYAEYEVPVIFPVIGAEHWVNLRRMSFN